MDCFQAYPDFEPLVSLLGGDDYGVSAPENLDAGTLDSAPGLEHDDSNAIASADAFGESDPQAVGSLRSPILEASRAGTQSQTDGALAQSRATVDPDIANHHVENGAVNTGAEAGAGAGAGAEVDDGSDFDDFMSQAFVLPSSPVVLPDYETDSSLTNQDSDSSRDDQGDPDSAAPHPLQADAHRPVPNSEQAVGGPLTGASDDLTTAGSPPQQEELSRLLNEDGLINPRPAQPAQASTAPTNYIFSAEDAGPGPDPMMQLWSGRDLELFGTFLDGLQGAQLLSTTEPPSSHPPALKPTSESCAPLKSVTIARNVDVRMAPTGIRRQRMPVTPSCNSQASFVGRPSNFTAPSPGSVRAASCPPHSMYNSQTWVASGGAPLRDKFRPQGSACQVPSPVPNRTESNSGRQYLAGSSSVPRPRETASLMALDDERAENRGHVQSVPNTPTVRNDGMPVSQQARSAKVLARQSTLMPGIPVPFRVHPNLGTTRLRSRRNLDKSSPLRNLFDNNGTDAGAGAGASAGAGRSAFRSENAIPSAMFGNPGSNQFSPRFSAQHQHPSLRHASGTVATGTEAWSGCGVHSPVLPPRRGVALTHSRARNDAHQTSRERPLERPPGSHTPAVSQQRRHRPPGTPAPTVTPVPRTPTATPPLIIQVSQSSEDDYLYCVVPAISPISETDPCGAPEPGAPCGSTEPEEHMLIYAEFPCFKHPVPAKSKDKDAVKPKSSKKRAAKAKRSVEPAAEPKSDKKKVVRKCHGVIRLAVDVAWGLVHGAIACCSEGHEQKWCEVCFFFTDKCYLRSQATCPKVHVANHHPRQNRSGRIAGFKVKEFRGSRAEFQAFLGTVAPPRHRKDYGSCKKRGPRAGTPAVPCTPSIEASEQPTPRARVRDAVAKPRMLILPNPTLPTEREDDASPAAEPMETGGPRLSQMAVSISGDHQADDAGFDEEVTQLSPRNTETQDYDRLLSPIQSAGEAGWSESNCDISARGVGRTSACAAARGVVACVDALVRTAAAVPDATAAITAETGEDVVIPGARQGGSTAAGVDVDVDAGGSSPDVAAQAAPGPSRLSSNLSPPSPPSLTRTHSCGMADDRAHFPHASGSLKPRALSAGNGASHGPCAEQSPVSSSALQPSCLPSSPICGSSEPEGLVAETNGRRCGEKDKQRRITYYFPSNVGPKRKRSREV